MVQKRGKDHIQVVADVSANYFWKSVYFTTQKMHISQYIYKTFLKELAIFCECRETFEKL